MYGSYVSSRGKAEAASAEASRLKTAGVLARAAADETDTRMREELQSTLGNIRAARAAAGVSMDSPTQDAIEGEERRIAERNIKTQRANQEAQAADYDAAAAAKRRSARLALITGNIEMAGTGLRHVSGRR
jgi:hypothetical protein